MYAQFNRFELRLTAVEARSASHPGQCDDDVAALVETPHVQRQLSKIAPDLIREELAEWGAWDASELADDAENQQRIVWIAAGNIVEDLYERDSKRRSGTI